MKKNILLILCIIFCQINGFAQNATKLLISDTRSTATTPSTYVRSLTGNFKKGTVMGLPGSSGYYTVLGLNGWGDDTGGPSHELAFSNTNDLFIRTGYISGGWGGWEKILTDHAIKVISNGNVLIGKSSQTNPSYKLDVNGNVRANKVVVNTTGADYVFDSAYHLLSLDSLDKFIKKYRHLPGVTTAAQMKEQGVDIGENQTVLLKKMEEMTLYIITLQNQLNELKKEQQKNK